MNLLDILSTSLHYFCRKWIGPTNENSNFYCRVKRAKGSSKISKMDSYNLTFPLSSQIINIVVCKLVVYPQSTKEFLRTCWKYVSVCSRLGRTLLLLAFQRLPRENSQLGAGSTRTNDKINPRMALTSAFEPGPQWSEVSAVTTAKSILMVQPGLNWVYLPDHILAGNLKKSIKGSSINLPEAYLFEAHLKRGGGGLMETGGLFNLEKTLVSILHEELEYKVEKLMTSKWRLEVMAQPKIRINFQLVNKPSWVSPHEVLQPWFIYTVYQYFSEEYLAEGRGAFYLSSPEKGEGVAY